MSDSSANNNLSDGAASVSPSSSRSRLNSSWNSQYNISKPSSSKVSEDLESKPGNCDSNDETTELLNQEGGDAGKSWCARWFPALVKPSLLCRWENYVGGLLLLAGYGMLVPGMFLPGLTTVTVRAKIWLSMWNSVLLLYEMGWTGNVSGQYVTISLNNSDTGEWEEVIPASGVDPIKERQDSGLGPENPSSLAAACLSFTFCIFLPYFKGFLVILALLMQSGNLMFWTLKISKGQHADVLDLMQLARFLRAKGISEVTLSYPIYLFLGYCLFASLGTQIMECQFYNPKATDRCKKSVSGIWLPLALLHIVAMSLLLAYPYLIIRAGGKMDEGNAVFYERGKSYGQILYEAPIGVTIYVVTGTIIVPFIMYVIVPILIRFHSSYAHLAYFIFPNWPVPTRERLYRTMSVLWDWALGDVLLLAYLILWLCINRDVDTWPLIGPVGGYAMCLYGVCNALIWFCYMINCSLFGQPNQDCYIEQDRHEGVDGGESQSQKLTGIDGSGIDERRAAGNGTTVSANQNVAIAGNQNVVQVVAESEPEPEGALDGARQRKKVEPEQPSSPAESGRHPGSRQISRSSRISSDSNTSRRSTQSESAESLVWRGRAKTKTTVLYLCQWVLLPAVLCAFGGIVWMCFHMSERPSAVDLIPTDPLGGFAIGVTKSLHDKQLLDVTVNKMIAGRFGSVGECSLKGQEGGPPANVTCMSIVNGVPQDKPSKEPLFTISSTSHADLFASIPTPVGTLINQIIVHHVTGFEKIKVTQMQAHLSTAQPQYDTWPDGPLVTVANFTIVAEIRHVPNDDALGKPNLPVKAEVTPWTGTMLDDFCCNIHRVSISVLSDCKPSYPFFENLRVDEKLRIEPAILHDGTTLAAIIKQFSEDVLEASLRDQLNKIVVKSADQTTFYNPLEERYMTFEDVLNAVFRYNLPGSTKNYLAQCEPPKGRAAENYDGGPPAAAAKEGAKTDTNTDAAAGENLTGKTDEETEAKPDRNATGKTDGKPDEKATGKTDDDLDAKPDEKSTPKSTGRAGANVKATANFRKVHGTGRAVEEGV